MLRPSLNLDLDAEVDELFKNAVEVVVQYDRASPSLLQRRLSIGYARAARLLDQLQAAGVISPPDGSKPREVLIHSLEEVFGDKWKQSQSEQEDVFEVPEKYKVPTGLKLSKVKKTLWGKQLSEVVGSNDFKNSKVRYPVLFGFDDKGKLHEASLSDVNNLIIVGNPVSKKENWIDTVLATLLLKHSPKELRFILIDHTHYLEFYNGIPHLLTPVITEFDKSISAFRWTIEEMNRRMKIFIQAGARDIDIYNQLSGINPLPKILIVTSYFGSDVEMDDSLTWLTGSAFKSGIHLFLITNRLNDQTISSNIKANIPSRAMFCVTSAQESKYAGVKGAENLGVGEMLYKKGNEDPRKLTTVFTPETNVKEVVEAVKQSATPT